MMDLEVPVLIVGGGGAGLTASMLLSQLDVESLLIIARPSTSDLPKAHVLNQRAMEILAYNYHHLHGFPVTCLRYFTVYGPRQRPEMAIAKFVRMVRDGDQITLYGDGSSARDYTYIDDIVSGTVAAIDASDEGYHLYNIGGTRTTSLKRLVELIEQSVGVPANVRHIPDRPGDVPITCADVSRAEQSLGYRPQVSIEEGISRYVAWTQKSP